MVLGAAIGGSVAMECDFLEGIPRPQIQWFLGNATISEFRTGTAILYVEGGRFLFIRHMQQQHRRFLFHCAVTQTVNNTFILYQRAPISYSLRGQTIYDIVKIYLGDRSFNIVAEEPEPVEVVFAASYRTILDFDAVVKLVYLSFWSCFNNVQGTNVTIEFVSDVVIRYSGLADAGQMNFTCDAIIEDIPYHLHNTRVTYSFNITVASK